MCDTCCGPESGTAGLSITTADQSGHITVTVWHLTVESALALATAMTAQHGEPVTEWLGTGEDQEAMREIVASRGVLTWHHGEEDAP